MWRDHLITGLRFCDLMEAGEVKLSWTKIGVACTTVLNLVNFASTTDWRILSGGVALHALTAAKHETKRMTETP